MAIMGLPLLVRTARAGFEQVTRRYEQMAETLGARPWRVFTTVTLPLASRNILAGALLGFTRALGEFGATIVVAGSIPGRTRTLAVGIYSFTETGQDEQAAALLAELRSYAGPMAHRSAAAMAAGDLLLPIHIRKNHLELRIFSTIMTMGTPQDVTLQELRIETFFPADQESEKSWAALTAAA
jgi:ABC-type phosphate transport system permease subunit